MLKQPQYQPMRMEEQVVAIYAATPQESRPSWVRELSIGDIGRYESELMAFIKSRHPEILAAIQSTGKLEDDTRNKIDKALDAFAQIFQPSKTAGAAA